MAIPLFNSQRLYFDITDYVERRAEASLTRCRDGSVSSNFLSTWTKNPQNKPGRGDIKAVYEIRNSQLEERFESYCEGLSNPNIGWYYHGTVLRCDIVNNQDLCTNANCSVCGICKEGFQSSWIHRHVSYQRFGHAFYLAVNSSKCHEYSEGCQGVRALMYCQVAGGNMYYARTDEPNRQAPPPGYDSVYGQKGTHHGGIGSLNYDEIAIYGISEAILPKYVIVYSKDGERLLL